MDRWEILKEKIKDKMKDTNLEDSLILQSVLNNMYNIENENEKGVKFKVDRASTLNNEGVMVIQTLKDLMKFVEDNGDIIIWKKDNENDIQKLTIYDEWIE